MNNKKKMKTIERRQARQKELVLEHLRKYPIVLVACGKADVARPTYYRWKEEDKEFAKATEEALAEGEEFMNENAERLLYTLMQEKHWPAIRYWLDKRHPKFNTTKIAVDQQIEVAFMYKQNQ